MYIKVHENKVHERFAVEFLHMLLLNITLFPLGGGGCPFFYNLRVIQATEITEKS